LLYTWPKPGTIAEPQAAFLGIFSSTKRIESFTGPSATGTFWEILSVLVFIFTDFFWAVAEKAKAQKKSKTNPMRMFTNLIILIVCSDRFLKGKEFQ